MMKQKILISVVMGVYNNAKYLPEAIESILTQTHRNFEFFLVNDGSTDNTAEVIKKYAKKDKRIIYLNNKKNLGQSKTRNRAIERAKGKYVAIADSDDVSLSNRLKKQIEYLEKNPKVGVLGTEFFTFTNNSNKTNFGHVQKNGLAEGKVWIHNPTCMVRRSIYLKYGFYNSKFDNAEDVELYFRWKSKGVKFHNLEDRLIKYRMFHGNNVSDVRKKSQVWKAFVINIIAIFKYRLKFGVSGYFYTIELFLYFIFLSLGINKIYRRKNDKIQFNIKAHNKVSQKYEEEHTEIYNEKEQSRLQSSIKIALNQVRSNDSKIKCLDFGCGAGNLTQYLLKDPRCFIVSADISTKFLDLIKHKYLDFLNSRIETLLLNGKNLSNIKNDSFDFIALYSVLHHVPDYLFILKELIRVLKPGGILYIDHEASPFFWSKNPIYEKYSAILQEAISEKTRKKRLKHLFSPLYWYYGIKEKFDPRFKIEGDIHVFQDDHIEWDLIEQIFHEENMKIVYKRDYLLFNKYCPENTYYHFNKRINDIRLIIVRKEI